MHPSKKDTDSVLKIRIEGYIYLERVELMTVDSRRILATDQYCFSLCLFINWYLPLSLQGHIFNHPTIYDYVMSQPNIVKRLNSMIQSADGPYITVAHSDAGK